MMKKMLVFLAVVAMAMMLAGCGNEVKWGSIKVEELTEEPKNWQSEEAMSLYEESKLPYNIQQEYIKMVQEKGAKKVYLENPNLDKIYISADGEEIYLEGQVKFFKSGKKIVQISRSWRVFTRYEFASDGKTAKKTTIEIDIPDENNGYAKVAETDDFTIVYDTQTEEYKCVKYGEVLGTSRAANLDALLYAEKVKDKNDNSDENCDYDQTVFQYKDKEYVLMIYKKGGNFTFNVLEKTGINYHEMKEILVNGNLELKAYVAYQ